MTPFEQRAILIADLGYGDAGKGSLVDYLTRTTHAHTVVRYNGGAQAAHNVITPDGRHHTFAQFGSGTFVPGTRTHLSRFMMVHPLAMLAEERHLQSLGIFDAFARTSIDGEALIITPFQQAANRIKEMARGQARHGSCGLGIGETMSDWLAHGSDVLFAGDLHSRLIVVEKLRQLREVKLAQLESILGDVPTSEGITAELSVFHEPEFIDKVADLYVHFARQVKLVRPEHLGQLLDQPGTLIFEGAQGILLDEWYGFYPYNSWSTLTFKNADALLLESGYKGETVKLGVVRAYATRHGTGPFVTEDKDLSSRVRDYHNGNNAWQHEFRVGHLDLITLRYALKVAGRIDGLVVTNLDRLNEIGTWQTCNRYQGLQGEPEARNYFAFAGKLARDIRVPDDPTDLARQEGLTRLLFKAQPVYEQCERNVVTYLRQVVESLGLPIAIASCGPTAVEKEAYSFPSCAKNSAPRVSVQDLWLQS